MTSNLGKNLMVMVSNLDELKARQRFGDEMIDTLSRGKKKGGNNHQEKFPYYPISKQNISYSLRCCMKLLEHL